MKNDVLLDVENLKLSFRTSKGVVQAVDGVDFQMPSNQAVVVIGESGCGKTSFAKALLRLIPRNIHEYSGHVRLNGQDTMALDDEAFREDVRWVKISMVPQAAMNSLNPVLKVGDQVAEPLIIHMGMSLKNALETAKEMFKKVGVPVDFLDRYAFELSGGMRQRVAIAMALVTNPQLVVLDEPTSALDLLTQANIMNLLKRVKKETDASFILITHDIATSSELADRVVVMYAGQIVEDADARRFFEDPLHPYSQKLMASVPRLRATVEPEYITGQPPSLINPPTGCRFAARCAHRFDKCDQDPPLFEQEGRKVKCWLYEPGRKERKK
ncbi:MAG: ABC transporter ATP-binding protein [Anaerolineales bacterium]|nr:ABC transporter ATP-binding protein [Anaerolineales bacterium]MCW5855201.1 ABC transporter ATP-binding protein [Anaerolineales bacterium]